MAVVFSFSGHETFPLRFSWLTKAVEFVQSNPRILNADEAIAEFGVGRNMVRAIKHWGQATGVLELDTEERGAVRVTPLGLFLFGQEGVDPYCEDTATLWLLHWQLCRTAERSTLWHFLFGYWRGGAIDMLGLQPVLEKWLDDREGQMPSPSTLKRDLLCLANTYVAQQRKGQDLEEAAGCPLASLGLLYDNGGALYLREGRQHGLAPELFAYAVLDYWDRIAPETETLAVQEVLERRASPGQVLLLGEEQAFELVSQVEAFDRPPFRFDSTAGLQQLYRTSKVAPEDMLDRYYRSALMLHSDDVTTV